MKYIYILQKIDNTIIRNFGLENCCTFCLKNLECTSAKINIFTQILINVDFKNIIINFANKTKLVPHYKVNKLHYQNQNFLDQRTFYACVFQNQKSY